ncbi:MAG: hypothetical protein ACI4FN_03250 [Acutalibacteraceae bacterium]
MLVGEGLCALQKHLKYKREGTETLPYELRRWILDFRSGRHKCLPYVKNG